MHNEGVNVSHTHLVYLNPFPKNLGKILKSFNRVLVPELNMGQLRQLIRAKYLVDAQGLNKVKGLPLTVKEIKDKVKTIIG